MSVEQELKELKNKILRLYPQLLTSEKTGEYLKIMEGIQLVRMLCSDQEEYRDINSDMMKFLNKGGPEIPWRDISSLRVIPSEVLMEELKRRLKQ